MVTEDKMIVQMTVNELDLLVSNAVNRCISALANKPEEKKTFVGIAGLRDLFHVGTNTAINIKHSGVIDRAITYTGAKSFITDGDLALKLWKEHSDRKHQGLN